MNGDVRITWRDVYDAVLELDRKLSGLPDIVKDHENRVRSLEAWKYALPPTLLLAVASMIAALR